MKCERAGVEFQPVTITLETQEEVDLVHALFGLATGRYVDDLLCRLYSELDEFSDSVYGDYWRGVIYPK